MLSLSHRRYSWACHQLSWEPLATFDLRPFQTYQSRPPLPSIRALSALYRSARCMNIAMHSTQSTNSPQVSAAHTTPKMSISTQRERLRAIVDRNADLFDPPNTAEAFIRLEAALDEAKNHSSADSDITGQNDLLDPPNTAERFARIEAAMDAVFAKPATAAWTQHHRKKSKFEIRAPVQGHGSRSTPALHSRNTQPPRSVTPGLIKQPQAQTHCDSKGRNNDRLAAGSLLERSVHDSDRPTSETGGPAQDAHASAGTATTHASRHESQRDSDIFRSSVSIHEFADKAYKSAREKYS
jgi:hypothetical protein